MLTIRAEDPGSADAVALIDELSAVLAAITGDNGRSSFAIDDVRAAGACFAVARNADGHAVGCGALRPLADGIAELKRMFARADVPGTGSALLAFLEAAAAAQGYSAIWLATRKVNATAVRFYLSRGYAPIENYGKYVGQAGAICMGKLIRM